MGCSQSQPAIEAIAPEIKNMSERILIEVDLKKHRPGCTGIYWGADPTGKTRLTSNANWPRDGAKLRGYPINSPKGEPWLLATEVLQAESSATWVPAPAGAAMPFEYDNHYYLEKVS